MKKRERKIAHTQAENNVISTLVFRCRYRRNSHWPLLKQRKARHCRGYRNARPEIRVAMCGQNITEGVPQGRRVWLNRPNGHLAENGSRWSNIS